MTYTSTSSTNFDKTVVTLIQKRLEEELRGTPGVHLADALRATYVKGTNGTMRFLRIPDLTITTGTPTPGTPPWLTQGTAPAPEGLTFGYEEMTAYQLGRTVGVYDVVDDESPFDLVAAAAEKTAFAAALTLDQYMADVIAAADPVSGGAIYSGTSNAATADVAAGDLLTGLDIKKAVKALAVAKVPRFADGYYHAIINPACTYGLQVDDDAGGWIDAHKYTDAMPLLSGELGRYAGVRFMESPYTHVREDSGTSSIDIYDTLVYGPNAWAFGDLQTVKAYFERGGGVTDPLQQIRGIVGYKAMIGALVLDEAGARFARIQSAGA